jgi:hypothetical protein
MKMSSNRVLNTQRFTRVIIAVLVIWIASAAFSMYLLTRFDTLVHSQLYNFGLQFDHAWADSYYLYTQLMVVALGVPMVLSVFFIAAGFKRTIDKKPEPAPKQESKVTQPQPRPAVCEERKVKVKENGNKSMVISCSSCKKVISRPLVMLNFEGGKTRPVNVCPYCNHLLGNAGSEKSPESDFQIADTNKKLAR